MAEEGRAPILGWNGSPVPRERGAVGESQLLVITGHLGSANGGMALEIL
jgi:hypothetical protein